jgi:hypothetical protein
MEPEPTYPVVVSSTDLLPWSGPFPYRSVQDPFHVLPMFRLPVMPAEWDGYRRWLRLAEHRDGSDVLVKFGTNVVTVEDCLSLSPERKREGYIFLQEHRVLVVEKNEALEDFSSWK